MNYKHSPLPWKLDSGPTHPHHQIHDREDNLIAFTIDHTTESQPDAEFIVRAVNNHDSLVNVIRTILHKSDAGFLGSPNWYVWEEARDALEKATEKKPNAT